MGAGNSAGQAAVYLSSQVAKVWLIVRGPSLEASMSRYLVERIAAQAECRGADRDRRSPPWKDRMAFSKRSAGAPVAPARRPGARSAICSCSSAPSRIPIGCPRSGVTLDDKGFVRDRRGIPAERSKPVCPACSRSATCARDRSSASPQRSAKAPRWSRRCTLFWRKPATNLRFPPTPGDSDVRRMHACRGAFAT